VHPTHRKRRYRKMRKRALLTGAVMIVIGMVWIPLSAQEMGLTVGLKSGAINTGVHSEMDEFLNTDWRSGFTGGGFVSVDLTPVIVIQADLLFSRRGFGFRMYDEVVGLIPGEARVRSLEVPLLLAARLPWVGTVLRPRIFAGPTFGFEVSCKVKGVALGTRFDEDCHEPAVGFDTHRSDWGVSVGGGLEIALDPLTVIVDGRYTHGLRNLNADSLTGEELMSRAWSFTVGLGRRF
jgi:hypothetical protein